MSSEWFWDHDGQKIGPLTQEQIVTLIQQHKFKPDDKLKISENGVWFSYHELDLKLHESISDSKPSASQNADDFFKSQGIKNVIRLQHEIAEEKSSTDFTGKITKVFGPLTELFNIAAGYITNFIFSKSGQYFILGSCLLFLTIFVTARISWYPQSTSAIYHDLNDILNKTSVAYQKQVSPEDWKMLTADCKNRLTIINHNLDQLIKSYPISDGYIYKASAEKARMLREYKQAEFMAQELLSQEHNSKKIKFKLMDLSSRIQYLDKAEKQFLEGKIPAGVDWSILALQLGIPQSWIQPAKSHAPLDKTSSITAFLLFLMNVTFIVISVIYFRKEIFSLLSMTNRQSPQA